MCIFSLRVFVTSLLFCRTRSADLALSQRAGSFGCRTREHLPHDTKGCTAPSYSISQMGKPMYIYMRVCVCINCINITICHSPSGTQILVLMLILCLSRQTGGRFRKHESTMIYGCCVKSRCQKQLICLLEQHVQARKKSDRKDWERMRT